MSDLALKGVKVLDFSWLITGPLTSKILGDFGAEVVKVESLTRPDESRLSTPFNQGIRGINRSTSFAYYNTSKYSISLNMNKSGGIRLARRLTDWADIVIESFRPGKINKLGLGYEELGKTNPGLIMIGISTQGQAGAFAAQPSTGLFLQAALGFSHLTGWPDREPTTIPTAYPDFITPWFLLIAAMSALDYRERTGKGQYIDASQMESSLHFLAPSILDFSVNGRVQGRDGNRSPDAAPHGVYRCLGVDRWCAIAVANDDEWKSFCKVIGNPEWTLRQDFTTLAGRKAHELELNDLIGEWTASRWAEDVRALMQAAGVGAGVVQNGEDLLNSDEQLEYRKHFWKREHPEYGQYVSAAPPFVLSETPARPMRDVPCLGENTEYVCRDILKLSDEEFVQYLSEGVLE